MLTKLLTVRAKLLPAQLLFVILNLCCFISQSWGQASAGTAGLNISKTYPSPDVASLGTYGLIPANPFNGLTNVSIPLYTVSYKELQVPITMSYSTGGLKPDDHPGWLGLGWTLQSGGMIYRRVMGNYDEFPPGESPTTSGTFNNSYYDNCGRVSNSFNNLDTIIAYTLVDGLSQTYDAIPDEFIFNFNGYSGTFYLTRATMNGPLEIRIKPNGAYKLKAEIVEVKSSIEFNDWLRTNGSTFETRRTSRSIYKLKITDDKGVQYIFGGNPNAIEFSNNGDFSRDFYTIASAWHLTEVVSPMGYKIQLIYKKKGRVISQHKQRNALFYNISYDYGSNFLILFNSTSGSHSYSGGLENVNFMIQNPAYLDSIKTPLQNIVFTSSRTTELDYPFEVQKLQAIMDPDHKFGADESYWQKLDEINITGLKRIRFHYRHQADKRLRLDSVEFRTASQEKIMKYDFIYNGLSLPAYNSRMTDHWGYYNGRSYAYSNDYLTIREPVAQYLQAEMLQQVNYPTGGYLKLEYEPHYYRKTVRQFPFSVEPQSSNLMAGGLRIKKMTSAANANDSALVKEYFYVENYINNGTNSSGVLSGVPQYTNTGTTRNSYKVGSFWSGSWGSMTMNFGKIVDNNFLQLSSTNGNHVTYSEVTERSGKGYTVYKYSNHDNGYMDKAPYMIVSNFDSKWHEEGFISLEPFRGLVTNTKYFDEAKRPVKSVSYDYFIDTSAAYKVPYFYRIFETMGTPPDPTVSVSRVSTCVFFTKPALPGKVIETDYVAGTSDSLSIATSYRYFPDVHPSGAAANDNYQVSETKDSSSKKEVFSKVVRYPVDMVLAAQDPAGVYQEMVDNNIVSPVIETTTLKGSTQLELSRNNYHKPGAGIYVTNSVEVKTLDETIETRFQMHQYDAKGNIVEQSKAGDVHEVIFWGYSGQYPVARIIGGTYNAAKGYIDQTMLDSAHKYTDEQIRTELNKLRTNLPNVLVTTYTYAPVVGMTSETDPQGITTYYEYDGAGRLRIIRDQDRNVVKKICYNYAGQPTACDGTVYYNTALSRAYTRTNCGVCEVGSTVTYTVAAGTYYSELSQADADAKAQADTTANGQNYANTNGTCTKPPIYAKLTLTNHTADGANEYADVVFQFFSDINLTVPYSVSNLTVNYNETTSYCGSNPTTTTTAQTIVCNGTETRFNKMVHWDVQDGIHCWTKFFDLLAGDCYYYKIYFSAGLSQTFTRNNCVSGFTGTAVTYTVPSGKYRSIVSQADANAMAQNDMNANGQNYANANGSCVVYNVAMSQNFTRNNCAAGGTGSVVTYTVPAGRYSSTIGQADANAKAQNDINSNGQAYANANGSCTFYNTVRSQSFTRNNCTECYLGSAVTYTIAAGTYSSTISQADADTKAQNDINTNGQNYANANGTCTKPVVYAKLVLTNYTSDGANEYADVVFQFYSDINLTVPYAVTNMTVNYNETTSYCGSNPTTTTTAQTIVCNGTETRFNKMIHWDVQDGIHCWSKTFDLLAGNCYFYRVYANAARSQTFTRNNCPAGYTGTPVTYSIPYGKYRSVVSQADADAQAQNEINANGQNYANANGSCVFYNAARSQSFTRNNCPAPQYGGAVTYTVPAGTYSSTISQADADAQAQNDINANGQNYANTYGSCTMPGYPYVRMTLTNYTYTDERVNATLLFQFYSDPARTVPMSVSNLTVNYKVTTNMCSGSSSSGNSTLVCNGTSSSTNVQVSWDLGDGLHCWQKYYQLLPGTGYYHQ